MLIFFTTFSRLSTEAEMSLQKASSFLFQNPTSFFTKTRSPTRTDFFALPEKLRGGRIEKFFNYWKAVKDDYYEACKDIVNGSKKRPLKAAIISTMGTSALYLNRSNPDERHFKEFITQTCLDLTLVPQSHRNPNSENWHTSVVRLDNAGLLRRWNLILFSIMWRADFDESCGLYKSQCEYLKPGYLDFLDRIVDVGCLGRWWMAEKALKEYDIDPEEWDEKGSPRKPEDQLKQMW